MNTTTTLLRPGGMTDSTPLLGDAPALRQRTELDGYLFFRGFLPASDVLKVREDLMGVVRRHGWSRVDQPVMEGTIDADVLKQVPTEQIRTDIGVTSEMYDDVQRLESVHRLPHHPKLVELYRSLFGSEVLVHPRHIVRMITPHHAMVPTPVHQDFPLIQGTSNTWTCWCPAGDCGRDLGGLAVLRSSHRNDYLPVQEAPGAGGIMAQLCPGETDWVTTDYAAGDVLTFPSYMVHKGTPCTLPNRIRLSLDVRYQPVDEYVEARSLHPHCDLTWEQIYAAWEQDDLKYYWERMPLKMSSWDDSLMKPSRRIC